MANVIQLVRCAFGKHARDRRAAWFDGNLWRSTCVGCKRPMVREFDGWRMAEEESPVPHDRR